MAISGMDKDFYTSNLYFANNGNNGSYSNCGTSNWTVRNASSNRNWLKTAGFTTGGKNVTKIRLFVHDCSLVTTYGSSYKAILGLSSTDYNPASYTSAIPSFTYSAETQTNYYNTYTYNTYYVDLNVNLNPNTTYYMYAATTSGGAWPVPTYNSSSRYTHFYVQFLTSSTATYTITYNVNGGSGGPGSATMNWGAGTLSNTKPTRAGYAFKNWNTKADGTGTSYNAGASYTATANATLYAQWTANTYYVKYNSNGGTGTMSNSTHTYGTAKALTANAFTRTGYTFKNWNTVAGGTGTTYTNQQSVSNLTTTSGGTVNLYAQWTANTYTVTFNSNGGTTPSPTSKTVTYNSTYGTLPTVTRTGYTFAGWYTAASGGTQVTSSTTVTITAAQTLYAHWTVNSYQFTLGSCTGVSTTGSTTSGSKNYGTTITLKATVSAGYTWDQWTSSNTSLVGHKADASSSFTMPAGAITMTPKATANLYYVHYNGNGSTGGTMSNSTHTYGTSKNLTKNAYTKDGYEFLGWSTSATGDVIYADQQSVLNLTTTNNGTVTLYAVWEPLSQLFIWHNGAWHRALRYIYTTTDGGTPYTLTVQKASSTASSYSHSVYETNSSNQLVSTTTGSSSTCTIYDNKTTLVQINRTNGQTIRLTLISGNATIKTHSSVATYKIFSITNPTSNIVCQYDVDEKIFEM